MVALDAPPTDPLHRPLHLKRKGAYDGSVIGGGDGDRRLTAYEVIQLLSNRSQPDHERAVGAGATLADLDPLKVSALHARLGNRPTRAFATPDGTRFLDNATCDGTIPEMLEAVIAAARRTMRSAFVIRGSGRPSVAILPRAPWSATNHMIVVWPASPRRPPGVVRCLPRCEAARVRGMTTHESAAQHGYGVTGLDS